MIKFDSNNINYKFSYEYICRQWESSLKNGEILSVLFVGVGGQGIILATAVLAHAAMNAGLDVKVSEVHGMAQRGGSVEGSVRMAKKVFSPTINKADFIVALEKLEGLRYVKKLCNDGLIIINNYEIYPSTVFERSKSYPSDIEADIKMITDRYLFIDAVDMARKLNEIRASNTVLLGVLSKFLPLSYECWVDAIRGNVPGRAIDQNIEAFNAGRNYF